MKIRERISSRVEKVALNSMTGDGARTIAVVAGYLSNAIFVNPIVASVRLMPGDGFTGFPYSWKLLKF